MRTALEAQKLVAQFNECTPSNWPVISVLPADIYRLAPANIKAPNPSRDYRYLSVEPYLEGRYKKFNGNNGFVSGVSAQGGHAYRQDGIAQTFPHWTYEHTMTTSGGSAADLMMVLPRDPTLRGRVCGSRSLTRVPNLRSVTSKGWAMSTQTSLCAAATGGSARPTSGRRALSLSSARIAATSCAQSLG
jgi:hypothetical protein